MGGNSPLGIAQAANIAPAAGPNCKATYATPQDIAEGKRVAEASCASCHGIDGIAKAKDMPHIAGQRPGYLYLELRVYQSGGRGNTTMNNSVKFLSDDALVKVSAYYASLDPAQPAPAEHESRSGQAGSGCRRQSGGSRLRRLSWRDRDQQDARNAEPGRVRSEVLRRGGQRLQGRPAQARHDEDPGVGAERCGTEQHRAVLCPAKARKAKTPSPGNQAAGKTAAAACAGCHGEGGVSTGTAPSLAGQDAQYFVAAMKSYKDGSRSDPSMKAPAASVDEATIKNLAAYYANQTPQPPKVRKPLTTAEMAQRCDRCHGVGGNSTDPRSPALAAQRADYLEQVMRAYQKGDRKSTAMAAMLDGVSDADIDGLAAHYARQKARSVVYVPLPAK